MSKNRTIASFDVIILT